MGRLSVIRRDAFPILILAGLPALLVLPFLGEGAFLGRHPALRDLPWCRTGAHVLAEEEPLNHVFSDSVNLLLPDLAFARRPDVGSGLIPAWNPDLFCGVPHAANPLTASFYPVSWLLREQEALDALALAAALHMALLGGFAYGFLRLTGRGAAAALFGALGAQLSGWVAAHLQNVQLVAVMAWIPLGLLAIEGRVRGRGPWCEPALALSLAGAWLAGFPQLAFLGSLALALYALVALLAALPRLGADGLARAGVRLLVAALLGLALAAPQIRPTTRLAETAGHSGRTLDDLAGDRLRPAVLVGAVLPRMLGDPMRNEPWREHWGARIVLGEPEPGGILPPPAVGWGERTLYPGLLVLVLACVGLAGRPRGPAVGLALVALAGASVAMSRSAIEALHGIPGFDFGAPSRAIALPGLALPLLAAGGLERVLRSDRRPRALRIAGFALLIAAALAGLTALAAWLFEDDLLAWTIRRLKDAGVEARFGVTAPRPVADYLDAMRPAFRDLRGDLAHLGVLGVLAGLAFWRTRGRTLAILSTLLLAVDLLAFMIPVNLPVTREALFEETPALTWLRERRDEGRILRIARDEATALREADSLLVPNLGLLYGLRDVQGWRELVPREYLALWEGVSARVTPVGFAAVPVDALRAPVVALTRARWLVASEPLEALEAWRAFPPPGERAALTVYENPEALPPAWVVHDWRLFDARDAQREALASEAFDPRLTVALAREAAAVLPPGGPVTDARGTASLTRLDAERLEIRCDCSDPGVLVIPETWDPGWTARIGPETAGDEALRDTPVLAADACFRAVVVPAGRTRILMTYAPEEIRSGLLLAGAGGLGLLLMTLVAMRRRHADHALPPRGAEATDAA